MNIFFKKKWPLAQSGKALLAISVIALAACGNQPPAPDWALSAEAAAQKASVAYLQGQQRVEELQWKKARDAVASTGRPDLAARVELMRCAAQVASLEWDNCPGYAALAQDAAEPEQAYVRYLQAQLEMVDVAQLPEPQRAVASAIAASGTPALADIKDPLSRLVAAGVVLRAGGVTPQLLQLGVETASAQGWRRPLMAWLLLQRKAAQQAGDMQDAAAIDRRLKLLDVTLPR
ncbi:MAG: hypothetical protein LBJ15_04000 [Comamonas sp.]|jgi:hypothetical protein|uniref:hypothetical protein n=1 Tax=Comamonas sp. TaxID=34028 RepID=UPI002836C9FA|nr:hypothetical protein [Comamonas sp.]MDR0213151.1 hypothetical protein [Comamonas sp.]